MTADDPGRRADYARQEAELDELYRDIILDHYRHPRRKGRLAAPTATHEGLNPLCGDEVTIEVIVRDGRIQDIAYMGSGCSISQSSASMMTEAVHGKPVAEVRGLIADFTAMMRGSDDIDPESLGDLEALGGVRKFPVRVKCATLAWHTLDEALAEPK
ncbi:MAG: SUF system NifU family Fe-S cluster assembly protein [Dehalococcoidia bacterium]|nr:SUF system NifU family Fe-S cluster assembly protein [Dehalococcoidia bacterium]